MNFDKRKIKIGFFPNNRPENLQNETYYNELVVYPVLIYKVLSPKIDDITLNIFQKHILSILNKGNYTSEEIADWMELDIDLVNMIIVELINKDFLDNEKRQLTKKGKAIINGTFSWFTNAEDIRKDINYIIQDSFTGEVYPIVLPFENIQEIESNSKSIKVNLKGKKESFEYTFIEPTDRNSRKPSNESLFKAFSIFAEQYIPTNTNDTTEFPNAIKFLDEEPTLLFLATWICLDKTIKNEDEITILDPFNITEGNTHWLNTTFLKAKTQSKELATIYNKLTIHLEEKEKKHIASLNKRKFKEIEINLNKTFHYTLENNYPKVFKALKEYWFELTQYKSHNESMYLKNAFVKSQTVLETMFGYLYTNFKDDYDDVLDINMNDRNKIEIKASEIINKLKQLNPAITIPNNWNNHYIFNGVFKVLSNKHSSLRDKYITGILACSLNRNHPMATMIKKQNDLIIFLENVANGRNEVGHVYKDIVDNEIHKYFNKALEQQKGIEKVIHNLIKND